MNNRSRGASASSRCVKETYKTIKQFRMSRRILPHIQYPGQTYFIKFRTHDIIMSNEVLDVIMNSCLCCDVVSRAYPTDAI